MKNGYSPSRRMRDLSSIVHTGQACKIKVNHRHTGARLMEWREQSQWSNILSLIIDNVS